MGASRRGGAGYCTGLSSPLLGSVLAGRAGGLAALVPGRRRGRTVQQVRGRAEQSSPRAHLRWHLARAHVCACAFAPYFWLPTFGSLKYLFLLWCFKIGLLVSGDTVSPFLQLLPSASSHPRASLNSSSFFCPPLLLQSCLLLASLLSVLSHAGPSLCCCACKVTVWGGGGR